MPCSIASIVTELMTPLIPGAGPPPTTRASLPATDSVVIFGYLALALSQGSCTIHHQFMAPRGFDQGSGEGERAPRWCERSGPSSRFKTALSEPRPSGRELAEPLPDGRGSVLKPLLHGCYTLNE